MLFINDAGYIDHVAIGLRIFHNLERGLMERVNGIIVHQTGGSTAQSAFNQYGRKDVTVGAHFLIDKDGTIYQTASVKQRANHVGLLQSRCVLHKSCNPTEFKRVFDLERTAKKAAISRIENKKNWPNRFPTNADSIGIELVGEAPGPEGKEVYVTVTSAQNAMLGWLIKELQEALGIYSMYDILRHPVVGRKNETEASTAKW